MESFYPEYTPLSQVDFNSHYYYEFTVQDEELFDSQFLLKEQ